MRTKNPNSSVCKADEPKNSDPTLPSNYLLQTPQENSESFAYILQNLNFYICLIVTPENSSALLFFYDTLSKFILIVNSQPCKVQEQIYSMVKAKLRSS